MRYLLFFFSFLTITLFGSTYSIVFIHIGHALPDYLETAIAQARLFNKECPIFLIGNVIAFRGTSPMTNEHKVTLIPIEKLPKSVDHLFFEKHMRLDPDWNEGFWKFTTERFFYLSELIEELNLKNVFHVENDNMLYVNLETHLPTFKKYYPGMGLIMHSDEACVPGFIYIADQEPMKILCPLIATQAREKFSDMMSLGAFKNHYSAAVVDTLPLIMQDFPPNSGVSTANPEMFFNHVQEFDSIFDGNSIGQYLDGLAPVHNYEPFQYLNHDCVYDSSKLEFVWEADEEGRKIPYAIYKNGRYRINNIHVHSKRLYKFKSL